MTNWMLKNDLQQNNPLFEKFKNRFENVSQNLTRIGKVLAPVYLLVILFLAFVMYRSLGKEIFPSTSTGQFQLRLKLPTGTRIERTEEATKNILGMIDSIAGSDNVDISS